MSEQTKICKDCKFFIDNFSPCCGRTKRVDLVTGEEKMNFCSTERDSISRGYCGWGGQFFEPKTEQVAA